MIILVLASGDDVARCQSSGIVSVFYWLLILTWTEKKSKRAAKERTITINNN